MPRPTSRGWRTHQKASTSATKSGTRRRSRQGRKSRNSARANEAMMVLARAGTRIDLSCDIGGLGLRRLLRGFLDPRDRKSTRLNSSHSQISYAVFCLKKKKNNTDID